MRDSFIDIWNRVKANCEIRNLLHLSKILGVSQSYVSKKKKNNLFPAEWAVTLSELYGISIDWILKGEGQAKQKKENDSSNNIKVEENYIEDLSEYDGLWVECNWNKKTIKTVKIIIGEIYIIDPINPKKTKNKGKRVKLIEEDFGDCQVLMIESEWHMKRRVYSQMDICDLQLETTLNSKK